MPYSKDLLCNMALAHCGINGQIEGVDTEASNEASQCRLFYDHIIELLHGVCEWDFALTENPLALVDYTTDQWAYAYKYPVDCKLALRIQNQAYRSPGTDQGVPFKVRNLTGGAGKVILTDQEDAILEYNTSITNPALFNAQFAQAASLGIAAHICMPLRVDPNITKYVGSQWSIWLAEAINTKQREQHDDPEPQSEFLTARG